jgi:hypothetical protein
VGVFVAGSIRSGFPSKSERLLLNVAANEAAVGLREARLFDQHRRAARELDVENNRQKEELVSANDQLKKENEQREAAEEALRLIEARLSHAAQATIAAEDAKRSEMAELRKKFGRLPP